jgi:hypothetical protein
MLAIAMIALVPSSATHHVRSVVDIVSIIDAAEPAPGIIWKA